MKNFTRIISVALAALLMMSAFAVSANAAEFRDYYPNPEFICGDVNFDSDVSIKDATTVQKHLAKLVTLSEELIASGDVDGNGKLTISDATLIQKFVAKIIDVFPVEDYTSDYEYTANGEELKVEFVSGNFTEIKVTVETEGFYDIIAICDEHEIYFDLTSEDMEYYWSAKNNGENMYVFAMLTPGVYYANIYSTDDATCEVIFKAGPSQSEPPFDMDDIELAKNLKIGDKIDVKAGAGKYVYRIDVSSLEYEGDQFVIYTEDEGAKASFVCYTYDYNVISESEYYEGEGITLSVYDDGVNNIYYVVVTVMEDSEAFTLICDSAFAMVKGEAVELALGKTQQIEVEEITEEFDGETFTTVTATVVHKFVPADDGYYSFNFESTAAMMVSVTISDFSDIEQSYLFVDMNEEGGRLFDVLSLEGGKEYYLIGIVILESKKNLNLTILESSEEEYLEAQNKNSFNDATDDEIEYKEIILGEPVLVEFEATDDEFVTEDFVFTATEDSTIVLYSENSKDACVYVLDEMGMTLHMGDSIYTSFYLPPTYGFYYSDDFAVIGTVAKGETVYFSLGSYAEEGDSFYFTVVNEEDFAPLEW